MCKPSRKIPIRGVDVCTDGAFSLFQDRVWASVAQCLNCVIAVVDKIQEGDPGKQEPVPEQQLADVITSHNPGNDSYYDSLIWRHPVQVRSGALQPLADKPSRPPHGSPATHTNVLHMDHYRQPSFVDQTHKVKKYTASCRRTKAAN